MTLSPIQVLVCLFPVAQAAEPTKIQTSPPALSAQEITERVKREFPRARFLKPSDADETGIEHRLAPLIVEEWAENTHRVPGKPDTYVFPMHPFSKDRSVYYVSTPSVRVSHRPKQIIFLWWYEYFRPSIDGCGLSRKVPRGVRIVLGSDEMPVLWEALGDSSGPRIFFVSQSVELAAKKEFGEPLPGRKFSIERSLEDSANMIVAGVIDDGPVAMGPYVYVDASPERFISTIHCRCSASQFGEAVETTSYRLWPLDVFDDAWLRNNGVNEDKLFAPEPLDKLFRWPKP